MVGSFEVRIACSLVSFLFARLGEGSLDVFPNVKDFVF